MVTPPHGHGPRTARLRGDPAAHGALGDPHPGRRLAHLRAGQLPLPSSGLQPLDHKRLCLRDERSHLAYPSRQAWQTDSAICLARAASLSSSRRADRQSSTERAAQQRPVPAAHARGLVDRAGRSAAATEPSVSHRSFPHGTGAMVRQPVLDGPPSRQGPRPTGLQPRFPHRPGGRPGLGHVPVSTGYAARRGARRRENCSPCGWPDSASRR